MTASTRSRLTEPTDPGVQRLVRLECRNAHSEKFYSVALEADPDAPGAFRCRAEWGKYVSAGNTCRRVSSYTG